MEIWIWIWNWEWFALAPLHKHKRQRIPRDYFALQIVWSNAPCKFACAHKSTVDIIYSLHFLLSFFLSHHYNIIITNSIAHQITPNQHNPLFSHSFIIIIINIYPFFFFFFTLVKSCLSFIFLFFIS